MGKAAKIDYDKEQDTLFAYTGEKVNDSLEVGDFIIDFDKQDKIVGLEILEASNVLKMSDIPKYYLGNLVNGRINVSQGRSSFYVQLTLEFMINRKLEEKAIMLSVPRSVERVVG